MTDLTQKQKEAFSQINSPLNTIHAQKILTIESQIKTLKFLQEIAHKQITDFGGSLTPPDQIDPEELPEIKQMREYETTLQTLIDERTIFVNSVKDILENIEIAKTALLQNTSGLLDQEIEEKKNETNKIIATHILNKKTEIEKMLALTITSPDIQKIRDATKENLGTVLENLLAPYKIITETGYSVVHAEDQANQNQIKQNVEKAKEKKLTLLSQRIAESIIFGDKNFNNNTSLPVDNINILALDETQLSALMQKVIEELYNYENNTSSKIIQNISRKLKKLLKIRTLSENYRNQQDISATTILKNYFKDDTLTINNPNAVTALEELLEEDKINKVQNTRIKEALIYLKEKIFFFKNSSSTSTL